MKDKQMQKEISFGLVMFFICFIYLTGVYLYEVFYEDGKQKDLEY